MQVLCFLCYNFLLFSPSPLATTLAEQQRDGYFETWREICQQPDTLIATFESVAPAASRISEILAGAGCVILTGSGSSEYAGECVQLALQQELGRPVQTIGSGAILSDGLKTLLPERPAVLISLARSGDSPESVGAVSLLLERDPKIRHLIFTCNSKGKLVNAFREDPRVLAIVLDERTNDRSLVMTSSFTSLVAAARFVGLSNSVPRYESLCGEWSRAVQGVLDAHVDAVRGVANTNFNRAVFLGSGARFGSAREAALKMLEMTAGAVSTLPETYLGLRHGPMSYIHDHTLVVCFLSCDTTVRAYEADLIRELDRKQLGLSKVIVGERIPGDLIREGDLAVECPGLTWIQDDNSPVVDVVVGQLLAFFRCLAQGLRPDSPSERGIISRVVESFELYRTEN